VPYRSQFSHMCRTHVFCFEWPPSLTNSFSSRRISLLCIELRVWPMETYLERYEIHNVSRDLITPMENDYFSPDAIAIGGADRSTSKKGRTD